MAATLWPGLTRFGENRGGTGHVVLSFHVQGLGRALNLRMANDSTNIFLDTWQMQDDWTKFSVWIFFFLLLYDAVPLLGYIDLSWKVIVTLKPGYGMWPLWPIFLWCTWKNWRKSVNSDRIVSLWPGFNWLCA